MAEFPNDSDVKNGHFLVTMTSNIANCQLLHHKWPYLVSLHTTAPLNSMISRDCSRPTRVATVLFHSSGS